MEVAERHVGSATDNTPDPPATGNKPPVGAVTASSMRKIYLCAVALLSSAGVALAQPELTRWPTQTAVTPASKLPLQQRMERCRAPEQTVRPGAKLLIDVDTAGAFRQNSLVTTSPGAYGTFALSGDTLAYTAGTDLDTAGEVITIRSCVSEEGEDCSERDFVVAIGRAGTRSLREVPLRGGVDTTVAVERPIGELFCGSVLAVGEYDYAEYRSARFSGFAPGDSVLYRSARGSGTDELLVVLCNVFGTCDTTEFRFRVSGPRLTALPFFDDFTYEGPRPDPRRWIEDDVFVNDAYGRRAPSYGVATFDGVDGAGRAYGEGLIAVDRLTSAEMDLSDVSGEPVWVKYYVQAGGRGQAPEETDRLITQFKHADGTWREQASARGSRTSNADTAFTYVALPVRGDSFLYDGFQVRFLMRANGAGDFDNFNLDYVRVEQAPDSSAAARDIALARRPPSPLEPYTRVPFSQFAAIGEDLLRTRLPIAVWNHFPTVNNVSNSTVVAEDVNGRELLSANLLSGAQFNLPRGYSSFVNELPSAPVAAYRDAVGPLSADDAAALTLRYELGIDRDQLRLPGFLSNDTAAASAVIADEFAYDDGTAERGIFNGDRGDRTVVRYVAEVADTLRGLRIAFPPLNPVDARRQLINLQVYVGPLDENSTPVFEDAFLRPFFPSDIGDTVQAFTTYRLDGPGGNAEAVPIPAGEFYVGWQQGDRSNDPVQVGLDLNNDNTEQIFVEFGEGWQPLSEFFTTLEASLMIRPVFSEEPPTSTSGLPEASRRTLRVYPNPTSGAFAVELDAGAGGTPARYRITDMTGRRVAEGVYERSLSARAAAGLYVLEILTEAGKVIGRARLIVR